MKSSVLSQTFTAFGSSSCHVDPMAFLLADSFQSSLEKLNGEEQKATKLAAFELQIHPAKPGLRIGVSKDGQGLIWEEGRAH